MGKVEKLGVETALKNDEDQEDFFKGFWETWGLCNALCVRVVK